MIAEDKEFQISQYADGTLLASERASVDDLLKTDPAARQMLAEYRRLEGHLTRLVASPSVQWDRFAEHVSKAVQDDDAPAIAGRIGWISSWSGRMRIAAAVLIAVTAGVVVNRSLRHTLPVVPIIPPTVSTDVADIADVTGPSAEIAIGQSSEEVSVGPSRLAATDGSSPYADSGLVRRQSKVTISEAMSNVSPGGKGQTH